jgi:steroid 5-alpha reductase family enzyme
MVRVTHPFHPRSGEEFVFIALRRTWGEDRVLFYDENSTVCSLPVVWTDAVASDVFVAMAAGRSPFRVDDLLGLAALVVAIEGGPTDGL